MTSPELGGAPHLLDGDPGIALFLGHASVAFDDERYLDACMHRLDRASQAVTATDPFLFYGATGYAWVTEHLQNQSILDADSDDLNATTDDLADAILDAPLLWRDRPELVAGLLGLGVYALERAAGGPLVGRIVDALATCAAPLDLGIAHGLGGGIAFLARAYTVSGIDRVRVASLLEPMVERLLEAKLPDDGGYPRERGEPAPCRQLGWCRGDLSAALALDAAARALARPDWAAEALAATRRAIGRDPDACGIRDPGLCHGSVGAALLLERLHKSLGDPALARAAAHWRQVALGQREPGRGFAGVRTWSSRSASWTDDPGFLLGAAGVGLGLLAIAGESASWLGVLLV